MEYIAIHIQIELKMVNLNPFEDFLFGFNFVRPEVFALFIHIEQLCPHYALSDTLASNNKPVFNVRVSFNTKDEIALVLAIHCLEIRKDESLFIFC